MKAAFPEKNLYQNKRTFSCNFIPAGLDATVHFAMIKHTNL
ncbi:hypothetical protein SAMN05216188_107328 [Lentzea xinjiangensis]|uniref:Uncharacterized protein n=1 Tax=Lentzea xinjiangensis TaxID=402600 RepID=A0A1H9L9V9_9PSEU|nr:hypothetical protein SAMN05216188_107328 [Lentzea xinjiangensis]